MAKAENLLPKDGLALLYTAIFTNEEAGKLLSILVDEIEWKQEPVVIFGKKILQPRLTAWYGDENTVYSYSGITMQPKRWTGSLLQIKNRVESICARSFNSALLNLYRNGNDSMGWHQDNEKELGKNPVIASVSFGASRIFKFRHKEDKKLVVSTPLTNNSLLLMKENTQHCWYHSIPKTARPIQSRINITFRTII